MHATLAKFGYGPGTVFEDEHWVVVVRAAQPALGSVVLIAKRAVEAFGDLTPAEGAALPAMAAQIALAQAEVSQPERTNYLMLMMVDRHVHFHVIPRYEHAREWRGRSFPDAGWPGVPDLGAAVTLDADEAAQLVRDLREALNGTTLGR